MRVRLAKLWAKKLCFNRPRVLHVNRHKRITLSGAFGWASPALQGSFLTLWTLSSDYKVGRNFYISVLKRGCNFKDNFFDNRIIPEFYKELDNNEINHALVIENAINVLQENFEIKTNALDGLKVTEIIENIYEKNNK